MIENKDITVLVVDDEDQLRKGMVRNLQLEDFIVLSACCGNEALKIIQENPKIDFVLSDIRMPNGDGMELLEKTRKLSKDLPVVLLVTGQSQYTKEDALNKGAIDLLNKPIDIDYVVDLIKSSVRR